MLYISVPQVTIVTVIVIIIQEYLKVHLILVHAHSILNVNYM